MPFPFLAPINPWVVDIMEQREANPTFASFKNPYAVLTSGALVVKETPAKTDAERKDLLLKILDPKKRPTTNIYKGCIISNNVNDINLSYSLNETPVGYDFDGNLITVRGEKGRKISTPIIETIDIDTDGANNTLKTARVGVRCFSLKQFEMFETFFLKPGMNVLIEWGDASLLKSALTGIKGSDPNSPQNQKRKYNTFKDGKENTIETYSSPEQALIPKNVNFDTWCSDFSQYYRSDTAAIGNYMSRLEKSLGTYDLVAGKVLDYSFSINEDSTYSVSLEISQGNQISLAIPHSGKKNSSNEKVQPADKEIRTFEQIKEMLIVDFNLDRTIFTALLTKKHPADKKWEDEFYNFLKINKQQKDTVASDTAYISLRFILKILMNYVLGSSNYDKDFFEFNLQLYQTQSGKELNIIPVTSHKNIMSSSEEVIFPTDELPILLAPPKPKEDVPVKEEDNKIKIGEKRLDGTINGYNFHTKEKLIIPNSKNTPVGQQTIEVKPDERIGDACNIFIKYEDVVKAWQTTYTRIDFLEKILGIINKNSYGLFTLIYGLQEINGKPTIVDVKCVGDASFVKSQNEKSIYRFKPGTPKSIVKQFSFNFEMSNLAAGRQIFNSGKLLSLAKSDKKNIESGKLDLPPQVYKAVDNSSLGNADGWWSINNVEYQKIVETFKIATERDAKGGANEEAPSKDTTTEAKDLSEVVINKSVNFLLKPTATSTIKLIFKDSKFINDAIHGGEYTEEEKKSTLSPIDISITIDGFSGFVPGQYFRIDGVPEIYNQIGVFQITNVKHAVSSDGWDTTIEASHRIIR